MWVTRLLSRPLAARRAAAIISLFTLTLTLLAATLAFALDRSDFPSIGISIWWALQTVTTVGYGDFVPHNTEGRIIGSLALLGGGRGAGDAQAPGRSTTRWHRSSRRSLHGCNAWRKPWHAPRNRATAPDEEVGSPRGTGGRTVPDGARPSGDERRDLAAGRRLRHHRDHDPDGDRPLRPGDGGAGAARRQAGRPRGPPPRLCDRPLHLRRRLGAARGLVERAEPVVRLVDPRGGRGRGGAGRSRRPGRRQLPGQRPRDRLRGPGRGRRR